MHVKSFTTKTVMRLVLSTKLHLICTSCKTKHFRKQERQHLNIQDDITRWHLKTSQVPLQTSQITSFSSHNTNVHNCFSSK